MPTEMIILMNIENLADYDNDTNAYDNDDYEVDDVHLGHRQYSGKLQGRWQHNSWQGDYDEEPSLKVIPYD